MKDTTALNDAEAVRQKVRAGYSEIAQIGTMRRSQRGCCGSPKKEGGAALIDSEQLAQHVGYTMEELAALPEGANMGLSCGNPNALASLQPGEVLLDLGSGGGFDVFIAGKKLGATGRAIGVDMTAEMLAKARRNTESYRQNSGLDNVEFRLGEIEHLPVADASVDVVISNCVINLSPDKPQVWREIAPVLKPGGRLAVSDIVALAPTPEELRTDWELYTGCVAGASLVDDLKSMLREAGFLNIRIVRKGESREIVGQWFPGRKAEDYATSASIEAEKPIAKA